MEPSSSKIEINGENIDYLDSGSGKISLLFIHGGFIHKGYWKKQLNFFATDYHVVAPDLPGHGNSSSGRTKWTIQDCANIIISFIERLSLENVIIIGHSIGSDIMLETASAGKNVIGIIGIDCLKDVGTEPCEDDVRQLIQDLNNDFAGAIEKFAEQILLSPDTDPGITERITNDLRGMTPEIGIALLKESFGYIQREAELLKELEFKLHLVNSTYSPTDKDKLKKHVGSGYEIYSVKGTCHYPMIENPKDFNKSLEKAIGNIIS